MRGKHVEDARGRGRCVVEGRRAGLPLHWGLRECRRLQQAGHTHKVGRLPLFVAACAATAPLTSRPGYISPCVLDPPSKPAVAAPVHVPTSASAVVAATQRAHALGCPPVVAAAAAVAVVGAGAGRLPAQPAGMVRWAWLGGAVGTCKGYGGVGMGGYFVHRQGDGEAAGEVRCPCRGLRWGGGC